MAGEFCRFLQASDLHLEQPLYGLTEVPDHLRELLLDAPLQAAARVFETAILEDVDFVILAGDVVNPRTAGPRAMAFLLDQLEQLRDHKIAVYWCGGKEDPPEAWPEAVALPDNVRVFPKGKIKQLVHRRGDQPLASVIGVSSPADGLVPVGDFRIEPANIFTVAAAWGQTDAASAGAHKQIDYWALGGQHESKTLFQGPQTAHYAGSPQGRCPDEAGVHGCTLVQVEHNRKVRTKFIATEVVRWRSESLSVTEGAGRNDLQRQLRSAMQRIASEAGGAYVLVSWEVQGCETLVRQLRKGDLARELIDWMRTEFGRAKPAVWTTTLTAPISATIPAELYEEDTILGDFLRAIREHEETPARALNLGAFVPDLGKHRALASALQAVDRDQRGALLREAAVLGLDLLNGEQSVA
ncbi:MAG TPA: DNA repair exonuclease [Candidatus Anammoximicrobium sp.]|nr:DNA repair exonuclease [Candidatus Anammoximicrobium sp.]